MKRGGGGGGKKDLHVPRGELQSNKCYSYVKEEAKSYSPTRIFHMDAVKPFHFPQANISCA